MIGYTRKGNKVLSVLDVDKFFVFYDGTKLTKNIVKLDGEFYYLDSVGFKHVRHDDVVIFDKNKDYWSDDNEVIRKEKLDSEFAVIEAPWICPFLMSFRFHMNFNTMITVFESMLEEFDKDDSDDIEELKSQLSWILKNKDFFRYIMD
ncbi:hypothetical protein [Lactobacillus phage Maenad]|uniref:Uncharacterized protein n=1 Tax=Lactobacillus phage Maenad TaxID=2079431 RepID=A0A2P0ZKT4_9CAUD|nr:hypothetical protein HOS85_gp032 [Lactobacillus phage Maenad]AVH85606.1 hypothetical protein [Lactobacillus phage Maenad]